MRAGGRDSLVSGSGECRVAGASVGRGRDRDARDHAVVVAGVGAASRMFRVNDDCARQKIAQRVGDRRRKARTTSGGSLSVRHRRAVCFVLVDGDHAGDLMSHVVTNRGCRVGTRSIRSSEQAVSRCEPRRSLCDRAARTVGRCRVSTLASDAGRARFRRVGETPASRQHSVAVRFTAVSTIGATLDGAIRTLTQRARRGASRRGVHGRGRALSPSCGTALGVGDRQRAGEVDRAGSGNGAASRSARRPQSARGTLGQIPRRPDAAADGTSRCRTVGTELTGFGTAITMPRRLFGSCLVVFFSQ